MIVDRTTRRLLAAFLIALSASWLTPPLSEIGPIYCLLWFGSFAILFASQVFWIGRVIDLMQRFIPGKQRRVGLAASAVVLYVFFFFSYSFAPLKMLFSGHGIYTADPRFFRILIDGIFAVWLVGSFIGFGLALVFFLLDRAICGVTWACRYARTDVDSAAALDRRAVGLISPARRHLLRQAAFAVSAMPFAAATYGLMHVRLNVEVTQRRIALAHLPKAFEGLRIAQLSDLHISSFMPANEIRRCVAMTNDLKPDLVVLTGDYLSWDPAAQGDVVRALAEARAPYGVFGCLGNHETITGTESSITRLFAEHGIRMLRQERVLIRSDNQSLSLIGVDDSLVDLRTIQPLIVPGTVNILLCHWPPSFEAAAKLGIDLMLAGHTHGGQLSLESLYRGLCLSRLESRYVSGWYEQTGHHSARGQRLHCSS